MEIPSNVLTKLTCDNCKEHLSCGPILMLNSGQSKCARCIQSMDNASRNVPYEELAKLMVFPCRYRDYGCQEKVKFDENQAHEEECAFKPFTCPIIEPGPCNWVGGRNSLLDHCLAQHPENVFENPAELVHNITTSNVGCFLLLAFQILFLIQTKVCTTSSNIYHAVQLIGDWRNISKYQFNIEIENNGKKLSIPGKVAPHGCMDAAVPIGCNTILKVLGDLKDTIFRIIIQMTDMQETENSTTVENVCVQGSCGKCGIVRDLVYQNECEACAPDRRTCANRSEGCLHIDVIDKCWKHETFYCSYQNMCKLCNSLDVGVSLTKHYSHRHTICEIDRYVIYITNDFNPRWNIIGTDFGHVMCLYNNSENNCFLFIYTPIPTAELKLFKCLIEIRDPLTGYSSFNTPEVTYNSGWDWYLCIPIAKFQLFGYNNKLGIKINFVKNKNVSY